MLKLWSDWIVAVRVSKGIGGLNGLIFIVGFVVGFDTYLGKVLSQLL